jgi:hypothetical protein
VPGCSAIDAFILLSFLSGELFSLRTEVGYTDSGGTDFDITLSLYSGSRSVYTIFIGSATPSALLIERF